MPPAAIASLCIAAAFSTLEILAWVLLVPLYARLLPLRGTVPADLPRGRAEALAGFAGSGRWIRWRWVPAEGALLFRNTLGPGRRPWSMGRLALRLDGAWTLTWAPVPLFTWPAAAAALYAWCAGMRATGVPLGPGHAALLVGGLALIAGLNLALGWRDFQVRVWPEVQEALRGRLGRP